MKLATTIDEQISLLRSRGVTINDEEKAKEILMDIGYYRLGFYLFPFETSYPKLENRTHNYLEGTDISNAVALYYFDFDLRNVLFRYINRVEIAFRTHLIFELSNKYKNEPTWFISPQVVKPKFIQNFDSEIYTPSFRKNPTIQRHHKKYINDKYAPAWKTIEFMTLGNVIELYRNLKCINDKLTICKYFDINQTAVFENYMNAIRVVRNKCAHGSTLFDLKLFQSIKNGPAGRYSPGEANSLSAAIDVIVYMIGTISTNRQSELLASLNKISNTACQKSHDIRPIIQKVSKKINLS